MLDSYIQNDAQGFKLQDAVLNMLSTEGYKVRFLSIDHLDDLKNEIDDVKVTNSLSESFTTFLSWCYDFNRPESIQKARSIVVCAAPSQFATN